MKSNKAKLREASKKARRTKKFMQRARKLRYCQDLTDAFIDEFKPTTIIGRIQRSRQEAITPEEQSKPKPEGEAHSALPPYMKRALPNPWSKDLPSW